MSLPIRLKYTFRWEAYMMLRNLNNETQLAIYQAINQYVFYGEYPVGLTDFQQCVFESIRPNVRAIAINADKTKRKQS